MEHVPIFTLVVITLLQLCRAQSSNSTPEWYAANDISDTNFSPKPITELFSTESSFSPEDPIVVLSSSSLPSNRGIVSSPTPITLYNDSTDTIDSQPPSNVIPLSSAEPPPILPPTLPTSQSTSNDLQSQILSTTPQVASVTEPNLITRTTQNWTVTNQAPPQLPRVNIAPNVRQNQQTLVSNRLPPQQTQPRNVQFLMPTQSGNRIFQGQQLPSNGPQNIFVLYEQVPQNIRNPPLAISPIQSPIIMPQQPVPIQGSQQQIAARPLPRMVIRQQPPITNQLPSQPNPILVPNIPPPNIILAPQPNNNNQQQNNPIPLNQTPNNNLPINNPVNNQAPVNQVPNIQQLPQQQQSPPLTPVTTYVLRRRPVRQRNRINGGRLNNRTKTQNNFPCQEINNTSTRPTMATNTPNPVITIRLRPSTISRNSLQINSAPNTNSSKIGDVGPKPNSQVNNRNFERCLNSCKDKKDRICAGPQKEIQINPESLKGFPSMCHMACHNTFRANPIYAKIANGRCGKLRTRIQTVDKSKVKRDELKKSQYTIISNIPGTVVELAP